VATGVSAAAVAQQDVIWRAVASGADATSTLDIAGRVLLSAQASAGTADVDVTRLVAEATAAGASASLSIGHDVEIRSAGQTGARADWAGIGINASGANTDARLDIGGGREEGGGLLYDAYTETEDASVAIANWNVAAMGDSATAHAEVHGDVNVRAWVAGSDSGDAVIEMGSFTVRTESASSQAAASLRVGGDLEVLAGSVEGGQASALFGGLIAQDLNSGSSTARIDVDGTLLVGAIGGSDVRSDAGINIADGAGASITLGGLLLGANAADDSVLVTGRYTAINDGTVNLGDVRIEMVTPGSADVTAHDNLIFIAGMSSGGTMDIDRLDVNFNVENGTGKIFLGADSTVDGNNGTFNLGNVVNLSAGDGAELTVWTDMVDWSADRRATLTTIDGNGSVHLQVNQSVYGSIDASAVGTFTYAQMVGSYAELDLVGGSFADVRATVIEGFEGGVDALTFGDMTVDVSTSGDVTQYATNGAAEGYFTMDDVEVGAAVSSEAQLWSRLDTLLDGDIRVAVAKWEGVNQTINGVNVVDDASHDWWAVAYDGDGDGFTSLTLVQVQQGFDLTALALMPQDLV
jgi:hypothetical protein